MSGAPSALYACNSLQENSIFKTDTGLGAHDTSVQRLVAVSWKALHVIAIESIAPGIAIDLQRDVSTTYISIGIFHSC